MTAATPGEKLTIYAVGLAQGVTLVTFPAASTIFTSPSSYGLSASQYGVMFVPQVITVIAASLGGAGLASRLGWKRVYLGGLAANLASMALLIASRSVETNQGVARLPLGHQGHTLQFPARSGCSQHSPFCMASARP